MEQDEGYVDISKLPLEDARKAINEVKNYARKLSSDKKLNPM